MRACNFKTPRSLEPDPPRSLVELIEIRSSLVVAFALVATAFAIVPACSSPDGVACNNGFRDTDEVGIDCGGAVCKKCAGDPCAAIGECQSGHCTEGKCEARQGKGCGVGTGAGLCGLGHPCELDRDCASSLCEGGLCAAAPALPPGPTDGKKNNGETDIDCGGPNAPRCTTGKTCERHEDCEDDYCPATQQKCVAPRSDDGVKNGSESDVDCGGTSGTKCGDGLDCLVDDDCRGACAYNQKCVDVPSCKGHFGGDTCGDKPLWPGEQGNAGGKQESCCRSLEVKGYTDPSNPTKRVYLDKYEITAGRVRAFIEAIATQYSGEANVKAWIATNKPPIWNASWDMFLPSGANGAVVTVPRQPSNPPEPPPWIRNVGTSHVFGAPLYIHVQGHGCGNSPGSYGFPTYYYSKAELEAQNDGLAFGDRSLERSGGTDEYGGALAAKEVLDAKSMTCIPNVMLAAFCHWDGGQLATDEVLDYITGSTTGNSAGCNGPRCPPLQRTIASMDAARSSGEAVDNGNFLYFFPRNQPHHEGTFKIASPGRAFEDVVRLVAGEEPWKDIRGNVHEVVLDMTGATFTGSFGLKYQGIGYNTARAGGNDGSPGKFTFPEYKAGYSGGRCMRFR